CGCAAAVVAIAAETIKTVAMRVFHWNMTPPSHVAHKSTPEMACGFRLRRGRGLQGAYMACDKFADHLLRIATEYTHQELARLAPDLEEARQAFALIVKDGNRAGEVIRRIHARRDPRGPCPDPRRSPRGPFYKLPPWPA